MPFNTPLPCVSMVIMMALGDQLKFFQFYCLVAQVLLLPDAEEEKEGREKREIKRNENLLKSF
jgi:hypothetical protein